jgi:hypothetical protein
MAHPNRFAEALLGGWNFRGITTFETGLPFSPSLNNTANLNSDMSTRPDLIGNPYAGINQSRNSWFNPAAYAAPGLYLFGTAGNNSLRGPNLFQMDLSLDKSFVMAEKYRLEFRWEVFNSLNRTNLALPVTAIDNGAAGIIQDITSPMRNMQFGLHLTF